MFEKEIHSVHSSYITEGTGFHQLRKPDQTICLEAFENFKKDLSPKKNKKKTSNMEEENPLGGI